MTQSIKQVAIYCRVSTSEQSADRQLRDLRAYAKRCGYTVVGTFTETASGMKDNRPERAKVIQLARQKQIDAILVTELTRWGRSTTDLLDTMKDLASKQVSLIAQTGLDFNLSTPQGKLMLTIMAGISEFERDLISERTISGLEAARANGRIGGRREGQNIVQDKIAGKVLKLTNQGRSVRWIAHELQVAPGTVQKIRSAQ